MKPLPNQYDHKKTEKKWQGYWEENQVYAWDETQPRENTFVIDTPPPTVSGLLHMGHIFSYTQADFVARYQRMSGKTVFYPMGFDDNGLPTERLVEKVKKVRATDMSREAFIALCEGVSEEARKEFRALFTEVALSVDWNQEYHTISEDSRRISQFSFLDLYHKNQAYRKLQPMLWDPVDQTAIAQAEVEDKEVSGFANHIPFGIVDSKTPVNEIQWDKIEKVEIMTTRPELLGACVALMCHPDDAAKYQGKKAVTPLFNVVVPIVADAKVDKEKGTGLVMCCTFGDETDIQWWRTHNLALRVMLNKYGKAQVDIQKEKILFAGSDQEAEGTISDVNCANVAKAIELFNAIQNKKTSNVDPKNPGTKEIITGLLQEQGLLLKQEAISRAVKCAERSGAPLEILPTNQWFVKVLDHKEALKAKAAECNWYPAYMKVRMDQWIDGLSWDWCVSRQRYFGVPFPIWYSKRAGEEGKILLADKDQLPVNPLVDLPKGYSREEVEAEADVMDTWATSSVSPQLSSKAINKDYAVDYARHQKLFPADLRPQAHEIIRTWAFYTVVKAHLHENSIPWKNLMISGWCLASDKTKMSKSKGNVITPVSLIEEKGSDVVRYWASTSRLGADTAYSEDVLKIGKKLTNKLWNASKFAAIHLDKLKTQPGTAAEDAVSGVICETADLWVLTRLRRAIEKATGEFERFEYCNARIAVEDFFWNDFCDNYLEMVKTRAYDEEGKNPKGQQSAVHTIYHCLDGILRLFAPFVPHITDELYSHIFDGVFERIKSVHSSGMWPEAASYPLAEEAEKVGVACVSVIEAVRRLKAARNVSIKWPLERIEVAAGAEKGGSWEQIAPLQDDLKAVTNAKELVWKNGALSASDAQEELTETENNAYQVKALFAEKSEAA